MRVVNGVQIHNDEPPPTHYGRYGKWLSILSKMQIGEYFEVDTKKERDAVIHSANSTRYVQRKSYTLKIFVRTQKQPNGKYRIWRVAE